MRYFARSRSSPPPDLAVGQSIPQVRDPLYGKISFGYFSDPRSFPHRLGCEAIAAEKHDF